MMLKLASLSLATVMAFAATPALAQSGATVNGVDQRAHLDCKGGDATVSGTGNEVHISGNCRRLTVNGVDNKIHVAMAANGVISVSGTDNEIDWTAPGKGSIRRTVSGVDNQIRRAR